MYIMIHKDVAIAVGPPQSVRLQVVEAEDAVKGDTATNARKPVKLETGATVYVPLFIKKGETITIDPETGDYIERS